MEIIKLGFGIGLILSSATTLLLLALGIVDGNDLEDIILDCLTAIVVSFVIAFWLIGTVYLLLLII